VYAVKLDTKAQIVGHWIATKRNDLPDTTTKMMVIKIISSTAIATIVTKRADCRAKQWDNANNVEEERVT